MMNSIAHLANYRFHAEPLEPFGELWTPDRAVDVPAFVDTHIETLMHHFAEKMLVVLQNTTLSGTEKQWIRAPGNSGSLRPHYDTARKCDIRTLLLHAGAGRLPTSFTCYDFMADAVIAHQYELGALISAAPGWIQDVYQLSDSLLPGGSPYFADSFPVLENMSNDLQKYEKQDGRAPQKSGRFQELSAFYRTLSSFYCNVYRTAQRYIHDWSRYPHSTIFAFQDVKHLNAPGGFRKLPYHFREQPYAGDDETSLYGNFVRQNWLGRLRLDRG